jgi:uncharacterized protein (TIGR02599 family)
MLVACAVTLFILVILSKTMDTTTGLVRREFSQMDAFEEARSAFDVISQRLSQATMNTYWDYYNSSNQRLDASATSGPTAPANFAPANYGRASDLHFVVESNSNRGQAVFFAAPESISADTTVDQTAGLLNAIGYYVTYVSDGSFAPSFLKVNHYRYRLMQCNQPTENFMQYSLTGTNWIGSPNGGVQSASWPLASNVIALIVWPRQFLSQDPNGTYITTNYQYDSRNLPAGNAAGVFPIQYAQAPPAVQLTMVAIDEQSAGRLIPNGAAGAVEPAVISSALTASPFTDVTQYENDLNKLQSALVAAHVTFQVFSTTVNLRESRWNGK